MTPEEKKAYDEAVARAKQQLKDQAEAQKKSK